MIRGLEEYEDDCSPPLLILWNQDRNQGKSYTLAQCCKYREHLHALRHEHIWHIWIAGSRVVWQVRQVWTVSSKFWLGLGLFGKILHMEASALFWISRGTTYGYTTDQTLDLPDMKELLWLLFQKDPIRASWT